MCPSGRDALDRVESLAGVLARDYLPPNRLSLAEFQLMDGDQQAEYNDERIDYLGGGLVVETPHVAKVLRTARSTILLNRRRTHGRLGVAVTGPSAVGKTTVCVAVMQKIYRGFTVKYPDLMRSGAIPVVYVEVPAGSSGKALVFRFADALGLELPTRTTMDQGLMSVAEILRACHTQLIVVDELHNLSAINGSNGESSDMLKSLSDRVSATFLYSGINLDAQTSGFLHGERGQQISKRFAFIHLHPYLRASTDDRRVWAGIVKAFADQLPLFAHDPKSVTRHARWLHERTGGYIGTLQRMIVGAAQLLIDEGDPLAETITKELLESIPIDIEAERASAELETNTPARRKKTQKDAGVEAE